MKTKNKGRLFKNIFLATTLSAFLLGGGLAGADEIKPKPKTEQTLEKKVSEDKKSSNPKIEINLNYETESRQEGAEYSQAYSRFYLNGLSEGSLYTNLPGLTPDEKNQVENIIQDIEDGDINSYGDFVSATENFSENQKLVLLAAVGDSLCRGDYDANYQGEVFSQEVFFDKLQNYLATGNSNSIGVCRHIASHLEQLANDIGIRAAAVTGKRREGHHVYNILKTENGTAIIDYGNILIINSKNIEKALEVYEKNKKAITFQHLFFEDNKLKYRLITKDGKNFLKFVGYDETSNSLKKELLSDGKNPSDLKIDFNLGDYLTSAKINYSGFFVNAGEIRGDSSSPMDKLGLLQIGYDNIFSIGSVNVNPSIDFTIGDNGLYGITGDLTVDTNNKEGLNLASRIAGNISWIKDFALFNDLVFEAGASYKIPTKYGDITPYFIGQFALFPGDLGTYKFIPMLNEVRAGVLVNENINNVNISFNPYFLRRIWEHEVGADLKVGTKNVSVDVGGSIGFSDYDFCPDIYNLNVGASATFGNFTLGAKYNLNGENYDGEIEEKSGISINGNWKY